MSMTTSFSYPCFLSRLTSPGRSGRDPAQRFIISASAVVGLNLSITFLFRLT